MRLLGHSIDELVKMLEGEERRVNCTGLTGPEQAYLLFRLSMGLKRSMLVLCPAAKEAERLVRDTRFFSEKIDLPVIYFPSYDILPFKPLSYHSETRCRRIEALHLIMTVQQPSVIVTTVSALLQKVMPSVALSGFAECLRRGEEMDRDTLIAKLIHGGYQQTVLVEESGDYAVRGALVDIFPPLYPEPIRIEFVGDYVDSIRMFSVQDQRSLKALSEVTLLPATETLYDPNQIEEIVSRVRTQGEAIEMPGMRIEEIVERIRAQDQFAGIGGLISFIYPTLDTLFDYIGTETLPVLLNPSAIESLASETDEAVTKNYLSARSEGRLCVEPEDLYLTWSEVEARLSEGASLALKTVPMADRGIIACNFVVEKNDLLTHKLRARRQPEALLQPLVEWLNRAREKGLASYLVCRTIKQATRIEALLAPYGLHLPVLAAFPERKDPENISAICLGELSSGFVWAREGLAILTEDEVFGAKPWLPKVQKRAPQVQWISYEDLNVGDLVVHTEQGVGRYGGLIKLEVARLTDDFLLIEYRDGDKLYVPVDRMNTVQKYMGVNGIAPQLDKMGGRSWERAKERVKKSIRKMAGELLKLYAWRKVQQGHAFSPHSQYLQEFEEAFEYTETPDQRRAVEEVMADMESSVPMDRLVCGDVGYGKTEIALRATFKAVWDNKQVAFLVPTTVLAEQHFQTFKRRFQPYPIEIDSLSRFRSARQQRTIVQRLKEGKLDVVIGTHRLLQKDILFKDLGLLIIDEEQRFGVAHKERLKKLRRSVDVLALTATPIPRTLHMSLMAIRDLSIIATPPEYRFPIKTYISPFDDSVVVEAVGRELERAGQIFFVHNNILTMPAMARHLQRLLPRVRIGVAHGRMENEELEKVMMQFVHHEIDLLLCTSIIESGLDFPSANTILINRADKFGLAQIYQLRGRVGRGEERAYAYLFIPDESALTRDAQKRLRVLMEHSDLGSGFQIAMSDLQIRGGGTILGPTQSGQIASVGYEMYLQLIEQATSELKGESVQPEVEPEVKVGRSAYIPDVYISSIDQRLAAYRRLAKVTARPEIEGFREELLDRFGPLPAEVTALLEKIDLKVLCRGIGVQRLEISDESVVFTFSDKTGVRPEQMTALIQQHPKRFRLKPDYVLEASLSPGALGDSMELTKQVLQELASHDSESPAVDGTPRSQGSVS